MSKREKPGLITVIKRQYEGQMELLPPEENDSYEESIEDEDDNMPGNKITHNFDNGQHPDMSGTGVLDRRRYAWTERKLDNSRLQMADEYRPESAYSAYDPADNDYDSDFESSETDDYEPDFDSSENESGNSIIELDYGNGISLQTTEQYRSQFDRFTTVNWRVSNPNLNIPECLLNNKKKMASDIFEIITKQNDNSDQGQITRRFDFNADMVKHILFKVPVFESNIHDDKSVVGKLYSFSVIIEENGEWKEISSKFENGFITFTCSCVDSFCIQSKPKIVKQVIDGKDIKINTVEDLEIIVNFKEERKEFITYKIKRPTIDNTRDKLPTWNPKLLIAVSDKIWLKFTRESLETTIRIPFKSKLQIPGTAPRLIGFKKGQPSLLETIVEPDGDKMCFTLKGYDGGALAVVQMQDFCYTKDVLTKELEIFYGDKILCNIILFVRGKAKGQMNFVANCVTPDEKQSVKQTTTNNGARCIFESDTLSLHPLQRIRIQVGGKIKRAPGYSNNFFLTFLCESKHNYVNFPVAFKAACDKPHAIIEFSLDNINCKGVVSSVHFELYWPYKILYSDTNRF